MSDPSVRVPRQLLVLLLNQEKVIETLEEIYRDYLKRSPPQYEKEPVDGNKKRKAQCLLDTNHKIFSGFTHHFRYTAEGEGFFLDEAKQNAAIKAGKWLHDVLEKSGSVLDVGNVYTSPSCGFPSMPVPAPLQSSDAQLKQEFLSFRVRTEEQMKLLLSALAQVQAQNEKLLKQNTFIMNKLEEIHDAQSQDAFQSIANSMHDRSGSSKMSNPGF